jgi:hypothetical protein
MTNIYGGVNVLDLEQIREGEEDAIRKVIDIELQLLRRRIDQEHLGALQSVQYRVGSMRRATVVSAWISSLRTIFPRNSAPASSVSQERHFLRGFASAMLEKRTTERPGGHGMAIKLMGVTASDCWQAVKMSKPKIFFCWTVQFSLLRMQLSLRNSMRLT